MKPKLLRKAVSSLKTQGLVQTVLRVCKYPATRLKEKRRRRNEEARLKKVFSHSSLEERFTEIYKLNHWSSEESVSGSGSTMRSTDNIRGKLPLLFDEFSVGSVLDLPCGDFNWMKCVLTGRELDYIGGDIVMPLITELNRLYENDHTRFVHLDLTKDKLPTADLMICRDCLFHLSFKDTKLGLQNFLNSHIAYLLTSTHVNLGTFLNTDIETGDFRLMDLFSAPYCFPQSTLLRIADGNPQEQGKELCLWTRDQVAEAVAKFVV